MLWQMYGLLKTPLLLILYILFLIFPLLFSISFHELAHGWTANKFGDPTAKMMGRLTLNPFAHLDVMGTILLLTIGLGWAKPVIVDIRNIPNRTQQMLVSLAGPASNFLLAFIFALLIAILENYFLLPNGHFAIFLLNSLVTINTGLGIFNLIPIPPMDGSRILAWMLPQNLEEKFYQLEKYGIGILMVIMVFIGFNWIFQIAYVLKSLLYELLQVTI